ncbi:uncharacterized protein L3040_002772 [Drepanopeziza brunnea f. sp. 'multigermtubi']|uniref:Uncharacterized protein n=1 Tax=Marssonina brunnea f. sp. multigermtubi (strain MB_m1) TaxID=1072389 RepID=K1WXJ2_MARBU|nr:uncharacterized protein MBM_08451 [Drepanopeziza brunnea f. sp. 'multigermtubi' MB_m1]EKD13368.1 hypothetical protein MBM_08451 [Drepanopeziza brunnea f. sp. 'multigermtubi' MB_m1]KAJ5050904.1 hypothetical protein L3040_002772 [Drepanopeziza brunnea f. sp. 'multigermtubi']
MGNLEAFCPDNFLKDTRRDCHRYRSYILRVFDKSSPRSVTRGALNFRLYECRSTNTVDISLEAAFNDRGNVIGRLRSSWSSLYNGTLEQSCDFDAGTGFAKAWVYMGAMQPVDDSMSAEHVPETLKQATWSSFTQLWCGTGRTYVDYHLVTVKILA